MSLNLTKGATLNLNKGNLTANSARVELGWEILSSKPLDLDAIAYLIDNSSGSPKVRQDDHFVFFNNLKSESDAVVHQGDNRSGVGGGPADADELININFDKLNQLSGISEVAVFVTIYDAVNKGQNFGNLKEAFVRIVDEVSNKVICEFDIDANFGNDYSLQVGSFVKQPDATWTFQAIGSSFNVDLVGICQKFGMNI